MEHLLVAGARQGEEDLIDPLGAHLRRKLRHPPYYLTAREWRSRLQPVVQHPADGVAILGKHRHPVEQQFAAGTGSHDQHAVGADPATLLGNQHLA